MYFFTTICCGFFIHYLITVICFGLSIHFGFSIHYFMQLKTKFLERHYSICLWRVPRCSTHFFFNSASVLLNFFWIELQMLLRCWLIHITIINETLSVFTIFLSISRPTIPHTNSETNPPPPWSLLFASVWDSFLAQATVLLLYQYAATLSRGKGHDYFCKVDHSRISINFSRNWLGLNNLCEIL